MSVIEKRIFSALALIVCVVQAGLIYADSTADWPMWRYDSKRSASTPEALPDTLHLNWVRQLPEPRPAWPPQRDNRDKLEFDLSYAPVVLGDRIFVGSMTDDTLTAYSVHTGEELWSFFADGPVRLSPVAWQGMVYFGSDDGYLYCLDAATGELKWQFKAALNERRVLGNNRLISMWPVRGGAVIHEGTIYFAAGVFPFEGICVYALDALNGNLVWANTASGTIYQRQPHGGAYSYAGISPQGYIAVAGDRLIISGGRSLPAIYDRLTGEPLRVVVDEKEVGGYKIQTDGWLYFNHGTMYSAEDARRIESIGSNVVIDGLIYSARRESLSARSAKSTPVEVIDRLGRQTIRTEFQISEVWNLEFEGLSNVHLKAGNTLFGSGDEGALFSITLNNDNHELPATATALDVRIDGEVYEMLAANGRLFVVTTNGLLYCFGPEEAPATVHTHTPEQPEPLDDTWGQRAESIIEEVDTTGGYALIIGIGSGRLIDELLARTALQLLVVETDAEKVADARRQLASTGLYGSRVTVHTGEAGSFTLPPYILNLIVTEELDDAHWQTSGPGRFVENTFNHLRPYGGVAHLYGSQQQVQAIAELIPNSNIESYELSTAADHLRLTRVGPLPGSDIWTHQYHNPANSVLSNDDRVKLPLGLAWFGNESNENILPRHAAGPRPQVADGRLVILGVETINARDVYTGRELWTREFPGVGHPFTNLALEELYRDGASVYMTNQPGASYIGSPYVTLRDSIYLRYGKSLHRLDPATGETLAIFQLPPDEDDEETLAQFRRRTEEDPENGLDEEEEEEEEDEELPDWGHISVWGDLVVTTTAPHIFDYTPLGDVRNWNATSSRNLIVLNRFSGEILWNRKAAIGYRHNAIAIADGKIFIVDGLTPDVLERLERRGIQPEETAKLLAIDAQSGDVIWGADEEVFATFLSYSEEYDILIESSSSDGRHRLPSEPYRHMAAYRGSDGTRLWYRTGSYNGPVVIRGDMIIPGRPGVARCIQTGEDYSRVHPLTTREEKWAYDRTYGCNTTNASKHMLLFRTGSAGYTDLTNDGGTGFFGGFRSGCTSNMMAADGVLNVPDYTRTCTCSYQIQTSLGMVHMPEVEMWTTHPTLSRPTVGSVRQMGINFGAPGSRMATNGIFWLEYPQIGGPAPAISVNLEPEDFRYYRNHSLVIEDEGEGYKWVSSSGIRGIRRLRITGLAIGRRPVTLSLLGVSLPQMNIGGSRYDVRLHFAEPEQVVAMDRAFHVIVNGAETAMNFDIITQAQGSNRVAVITLEDIKLSDGGYEEHGVLEIELVPARGALFEPVISGVEIRQKDTTANAR